MGILLLDCNEFKGSVFVKNYDYAVRMDQCKHLPDRMVTLVFHSHLTNSAEHVDEPSGHVASSR